MLYRWSRDWYQVSEGFKGVLDSPGWGSVVWFAGATLPVGATLPLHCTIPTIQA